MSKSRSSTPKKAPVSHQPVYAHDADWLDVLSSFRMRFGRFARDVGGVLLLALAIISLLALAGLTTGTLLKPWAILLWQYLGYGAILFVLATGVVGLMILRRSDDPLPWGRIFILEIAAFLTLALLTLMGDGTLERADAGFDGGYIGWGLVEFFQRIMGTVLARTVIGVGWLLAVATGFDLWSRLETWLLKFSGEMPSLDEVGDSESEFSDFQPEEVLEEHNRFGMRKEKKKIVLPPEFRKSLRMPENEDKRLIDPPQRDEQMPPLTLLLDEQNSRPDERTINQTAGLIEKTLAEFGIPAQVIGFRVGPTVTQFAVQPGFFDKNGHSDENDVHRMKVRVAQIANLQRDLALALSAQRLRIEAPVPGKPYVGIEVPNSRSAMVRLRPILETQAFYKVNAPLAMALGRNVSGHPVVADLARMPHLLIAGSTGSGKSVCITAIAACLAMNNTPEDLRLVMIDSKMVELIRFNGLPHLFGKVETDIQRIMGVLRWVVVEMEHRYRLLEAGKARDLDAYNTKMSRRKDGQPLPRIVVIIDELADLMMSAPDQTEHNLVRLAQMARATGIHLVVATQRPSTDVVTGLIKANFPARISFAVASGIDSRVILDTPGAETLLGRGDMLFLQPEVGNPLRAQGVMVTDGEIDKLIKHWQKVTEPSDEAPPWEKLLMEPDESEEDALVEQAVEIVRSTGRASASLLQRRLRVGYPRAARLLDELESMGVVGPSQGGGREREVLIEPDDFDDYD